MHFFCYINVVGCRILLPETMKKIILFGSMLALLVGFQASAQRVENDDMYFNSKDREKVKSVEAEGSLQTYSSPKKKKEVEPLNEGEETFNTMDSYSRSTNPEYISRSNSDQASTDEQNYFVEGYTPNTYDSYSSTNYNNSMYPNNFNNNWGYANNYYGNNYYSPYDYNRYGYYNPYGAYGNPYSYGPGWTLSLGYYSGWGYGGGNYGWGSPYYNSYNPYYSPYSYGGYNYYGGGYERSNVTYGKRPSRHSAVVTPTQRVVQTRTSSATNTSGRMRQTSDEYYVKPARRASNSDWSTISNTNSGSDSNGSRTRSSYSTPSRNGGNSYSTPSRSSSPARSGGGGSGGSSRSRSKN